MKFIHFPPDVLQDPYPVRLKGGSGEHEGRVEIKVGDEWGTICDNSWDLNDAHVICRTIGYEQAVRSLEGAYFGQGTGPIFLDHVSCIGTEPSIELCKHRGLRSHSCHHGEDAGVICLRGKKKLNNMFLLLQVSIIP